MADSTPVESQPPGELGRTIFKNTLFVTLGSTALKVIHFVFGVFVVRSLGDSRFGQYSIVIAFAGLFQILAELGMSQYVMREIARDRSKTRMLMWNLATVRFLLALVAIVAITIAGGAVGYSPEIVLGIFLYTCTFLLAAFYAPLEMVLTANERLDFVTGLSVLGQIVFVTLGAFFLISGLSYIWLIVASLLSFLPQIALGVYLVRRQHNSDLSFQIDPRFWPKLVRAGLPFGIITLTLTLAFSIDTVMLSMFYPDHVVGWYNTAYGLIFSLLFFFRGFKEAIVPSLSRAYVSNPAQVDRWYHRSVKFILLSSLPIAVGGMLVAFPLIRFLYTDEFLVSGLALQILIWDVPFLMFNGFCGNMTTIVGDEHAAARIYTINALANIILNLYAIPRFGLIGASLVTVVTDVIGTVQFHFLLRRKLHLPNMTSVLVRVLVASTLMGVAVSLAGHLQLFILIGLGAVVYGGFALVLRLVDDAEWATILRLFRLRRAPQSIKKGT